MNTVVAAINLHRNMEKERVSTCVPQ